MPLSFGPASFVARHHFVVFFSKNKKKTYNKRMNCAIYIFEKKRNESGNT